MHLESKFTMSLVFATTFFFFVVFFAGGGGGYFVTWLSRPILSLKFLDPWFLLFCFLFLCDVSFAIFVRECLPSF